MDENNPNRLFKLFFFSDMAQNFLSSSHAKSLSIILKIFNPYSPSTNISLESFHPPKFTQKTLIIITLSERFCSRVKGCGE
jgi:hypothetical protein